MRLEEAIIVITKKNEMIGNKNFLKKNKKDEIYRRECNLPDWFKKL